MTTRERRREGGRNLRSMRLSSVEARGTGPAGGVPSDYGVAGGLAMGRRAGTSPGPLGSVGTAKRLQPAHVLADVGTIFAPVDGIGTATVVAQAAVGLAFEGDLVDVASAVHFPEQGTAFLVGCGSVVG